MKERLEEKCRSLIERRNYQECEKEIRKALGEDPHSPVPHNLMGILLEVEQDHILAMKHFRAAYALDPTYIPARFNMEQYANGAFRGICVYTEEDCPVQEEAQFQLVYDEHHVGHIVRK